MKLLKTIATATSEVVEASAAALVTTAEAANHIAGAAKVYAEEVENDAIHSCNMSAKEREAEIAALEAELAS